MVRLRIDHRGVAGAGHTDHGRRHKDHVDGGLVDARRPSSRAGARVYWSASALAPFTLWSTLRVVSSASCKRCLAVALSQWCTTTRRSRSERITLTPAPEIQVPES